MDGEPPDLPAESYSEAARDFVRGCLNKIPKLRPTYAMLIRHGWLAPLMKPPTINEDEEAEAAAEAGHDAPAEPLPETADDEVGKWVRDAIERKISGKMAKSEKPALHTVPLDAVPGGPMLSMDVMGDANAVNGPTETEPVSHIVPSEFVEAVQVQSPELKMARVESMDFGGGVGGGTEDAAPAPAAGEAAEPQVES